MNNDPKQSTLDGDALNLYKALSDLVRAYQYRDRQNIYYYDVSATQCYALAAINAHGSLALNQLAKSLHLDKSTTSRVIDSLAEKGYVNRNADAKDARAVRIDITTKGVKLHNTIEKDLADGLKDLLKDFDPATRKAAIHIVQGMANSAKKRFAVKNQIPKK